MSEVLLKVEATNEKYCFWIEEKREEKLKSLKEDIEMHGVLHFNRCLKKFCNILLAQYRRLETSSTPFNDFNKMRDRTIFL